MNMKQIAVFLLLIFVILVAWSLGSRLSTDALGMAVGMVFGILAVIPGLVIRQLADQRGNLIAGRRHERFIDQDDDDDYLPRRFAEPQRPQQIIVIVQQPQRPDDWGEPQLARLTRTGE